MCATCLCQRRLPCRRPSAAEPWRCGLCSKRNAAAAEACQVCGRARAFQTEKEKAKDAAKQKARESRLADADSRSGAFSAAIDRLGAKADDSDDMVAERERRSREMAEYREYQNLRRRNQATVHERQGLQDDIEAALKAMRTAQGPLT